MNALFNYSSYIAQSTILEAVVKQQVEQQQVDNLILNINKICNLLTGAYVCVVYGNLNINRLDISDKILQYHTILNKFGFHLQPANPDTIINILRHNIINKK
jgi:hypothetical protein